MPPHLQMEIYNVRARDFPSQFWQNSCKCRQRANVSSLRKARISEERVFAQAGACSLITRRWTYVTSAMWLVECKRLASTGSCVRPRSGQTCLQTKTSASVSSTPWRRPDTMFMDVWRKVDSGIDMRRTESAQSWTRFLLD
jgi:hypothetical protein